MCHMQRASRRRHCAGSGTNQPRVGRSLKGDVGRRPFERWMSRCERCDLIALGVCNVASPIGFGAAAMWGRDNSGELRCTVTTVEGMEGNRSPRDLTGPRNLGPTGGDAPLGVGFVPPYRNRAAAARQRLLVSIREHNRTHHRSWEVSHPAQPYLAQRSTPRRRTKAATASAEVAVSRCHRTATVLTRHG